MINSVTGNNTVSIIVPVFNAQKHLARCIESIINQTHKELEIILIDDGSTDESAAICDDYSKKDSRINVFHIENKGVSYARNYGIDKSHGKWISFSDADDVLRPNYIEVMLNTAQKNDCELVVCNFNFIYEDNSQTPRLEKNETGYALMETVILDDDFNFYNHYFFTHVWGSLFNRELTKGVVFDEGISIGEDALYMSTIFCKARAACFVNAPLYDYYIYNSSAFHSNDYSREKNTDVLAWEKTAQLHKSKRHSAYRWCCRCIAISSFKAAKRTMQHDNYSAARPYIKRMRKHLFWVLFSDILTIVKIHYLIICAFPRSAAEFLKHNHSKD